MNLPDRRQQAPRYTDEVNRLFIKYSKEVNRLISNLDSTSLEGKDKDIIKSVMINRIANSKKTT